MSALDGNNRYPARLQAFITGQEVGQVAAAQKTGAKPSMQLSFMNLFFSLNAPLTPNPFPADSVQELRSQLTKEMAKFAGERAAFCTFISS